MLGEFNFFQVVSSEWFLVIQMKEFDNLYDAEIRNDDKYCCCDDGDSSCAGANIDAVNTCFDDGYTCDPYYMLRVNFQASPSTTMMCPVSQSTESFFEPKSITTSFLSHLSVTLSQSELEMCNKVKTWRTCDLWIYN